MKHGVTTREPALDENPMTTKTPEELIAECGAWWDTSIIDIHPGKIAIRGYPIEELIGNVRFPDMIWLMLRGELPTRGQSDLLEAALVPGVDHGPHAPSIAISCMAVTLRPAAQRRDGFGDQRARRRARRRGPAVHGALSRHRRRSRRRRVIWLRRPTAIIQRRREVGEKIVPGFGHRFHPIDPRTAPLFALVAKAVAAGTVSGRWAAIGQAVEDALKAITGRHIPMNIDGITAVIFCELGFEPELGADYSSCRARSAFWRTRGSR